MTRNTTCNECGGKMQRGFVVETRGAGTPYEASYWLEGKPERRFWGGLKTEEKQSYYITAYRCENCGFLKFYAGPAAIKK
jgi:ssDNA-binding Zn-finger/Zn-ribbon topoisomerase 1